MRYKQKLIAHSIAVCNATAPYHKSHPSTRHYCKCSLKLRLLLNEEQTNLHPGDLTVWTYNQDLMNIYILMFAKKFLFKTCLHKICEAFGR